ncbi:MAG: hypothetical protein K8W52_01120 [Deltaproteobacteria bacterium]|nr:hypothetical protein [Deltaproteobacteria bacterium]
MDAPAFVRPPIVAPSADEIRAAEAEEAREIARTTQRLVDSVELAKTCIPSTVAPAPADVDADETLGIQLGLVDGAPVVCAVRRLQLGPPTRPLGCWNVDLASGAVVARRAAPLPGRSYGVSLQRGCADGMCGREVEDGFDDERELADPSNGHLVISTDGRHAAMWFGPRDGDAVVFDRTTRKVTARISAPLESDGWNPDLAFVGDTIVRAFTNPADAATFRAWRQPGKAMTIDADLEDGGLQVLDPRHLGFVSRTGTTLTTFDVRTRRREVLIRDVSPCTADDLRALSPSMGDDGGSPACRAVWPTIGAPFVAGDWIRLPGGDFAVAGTAGPASLGEIVILDSTLRERRRITLARCRP